MHERDEASLVACIPNLRRYARGLVSDAAQADDLVQDTLERAWSRFARWERRGDLRAWMFGILHHRFIDHLRAARRRPEDSAGDALPELPQRADQADGIEVRDLDRLLQRLPAEQREVLLLVAVEEMSYAEAAAVVGVPVGTVMSRLARGRERLRQALQGGAPPAAAPGAAGAPLRRIK
jgi:RNA polymerase sigma-70 factor (ECF subfamily)